MWHNSAFEYHEKIYHLTNLEGESFKYDTFGEYQNVKALNWYKFYG